MPLMPRQIEEQVLSNKKEYADLYPDIPFVDPQSACMELARRETLLARLFPHTALGAHGTKLDMNGLSPGCRLCIQGSWSCLFVNGICNASCFYCPTSQREAGVPMTNNLLFEDKEKYVFYLRLFGFKGASISGGEPLLTLDKTLSYIEAVKDELGDQIYLWLYTNGLLLTGDIARSLAQAGLDEIRVDIGAVDYSLKSVSLAAGIIPRVTVEIPAVPEDFVLLSQKLPEMAERGVKHLNLHQMRLTPYNFPQLMKRGYTFLHGAKVTVMESELTALQLLAFQQEHHIALGINYCSFVYKNRFQHKAARRRAGLFIKTPQEDLTASGYIRSLALQAEAPVLEEINGLLTESFPGKDHWLLKLSEGKIYFSLALWCKLKPYFERGCLEVCYYEGVIRSQVSYQSYFKDYRLEGGHKIYIEKNRKLPALLVFGENILEWKKLVDFCALERDFVWEKPGVLFETCRLYEELPFGFQEYF